MILLLKNIIAEAKKFAPRQDHSDLIWEFYLNHNKRWQRIRIQHYNGVYYFSGSDFESFSTETKTEDELSWDKKTSAFFAAVPALLKSIYSEVKKDSYAYHSKLNKSVSLDLRQGIIHSSFVRKLIPEYRRFDKELTKKETSRMITLLSKHSDTTRDKITAGEYFEYCKIAYLANGKKSHEKLDLSASGFEMYNRWADGRDGGLKKINRTSFKAFEKWYHSKDWQGCHPWEIYRGGNSTHISMSVYQEQQIKKWKVSLTAFSSSRLVENCRIALALQEAKLPFELQDRDSYYLRLTGNDWIGIVPKGSGIAYAWHDFPKKWHVSDCIYFEFFKDDDGKSLLPLRKISDLVTWFPLPIVTV